MDRSGIQKAVTSISAPGLWFGDRAQTIALARRCNEYAANLSRDFPGRFGSFASLPLPDVDASLKEIEYALDTLKSDGVAMMTNYEGKYLGDPTFAPVLEELNRRRAVVYVHPAAADCSRCLGSLELPASALEFPFDTTRTITSLLYTGAFGKFQDIKFVFSHAGGTLPFLARRIIGFALADQRFRSVGQAQPIEHLKRQYYDTALSLNPTSMSALKEVIGIDRIVFGTDYPFNTDQGVAASIQALGSLGWSQVEVAKVEHENAAVLLNH